MSLIVLKNKNILMRYAHQSITQLKKCEKIFDQKDLKGYGGVRIYDFLDRYFSYSPNKFKNLAI